MNSPRAARLAFWLSRMLPLGPGMRLARGVARRIAARKDLALVQALRVNQWVVAGERLSADELDAAVQASLEHLAVAFFQLFHYSEDSAALDALIEFTPAIDEVIARSREKRHGLVVAGLHMTGFDLGAQAAARRGLQAIGLTLPEASEAIEWQHAFRRRSGMELVPATLPNLRRTLQRLAAGELVLTGLDRPTPDPKYRPRFFGRPSALPTHHIYLAQKAGVPIMVMGAVFDGRRYQILASDELHLASRANRSDEMIYNAERILEVAQGMICQAPHQWTVPHPVWPEVAGELPKSA